ncbi:MAG: hypothetical protein LDL11_01880 [Desulfarculus sp.]|nr:hypothetical protein [Desulfarculus sp.]
MVQASQSGASRSSLGASLAKTFNRHLARWMAKVDFVDLARRIAQTPAGRPWLEFFDAPGALIAPDQDQYWQKALELTLEEYERLGEPVERSQVEACLTQIACRYDRDIHYWCAAAICAVMTHIFDHHDPRAPFISADRRELEHLDLLKRHRQDGLGVVYLSNHSSHVDEFIGEVFFSVYGLGLPIYAAGSNMMAIPSLARVFYIASYVVQRRGASKLYLSTLYNYCRAMSITGGQQTIFLEAWHGGARARDGSLRYPRRLVTLRGAIDVPDEVVVAPVAISYAVVPEDLSLAARGGGRCWFNGLGLGRALALSMLHPKTGLWRAAKGLYGRAYCTLCRPRTLGELKHMHARDIGGLSLDEFVALTAIRDIAQAKKVMASQLTAGALVRLRREAKARVAGDTAPAAKPDLAAALEREIERTRDYHQAAFGVPPDLEDLVVQRPTREALADGLATLRRRKIIARHHRDELGLPRVINNRGLAFYATHGDRRIYSPQAKENVVVVGAGDWGFALTHLVGGRMLEEKRYQNHSLTLFDSRPEVAAEMGVHRSLPGRFENERLPKNVFVTHDAPSAFKKASEVVLATGPETFVAQVEGILTEVEQPLRVVVATSAFVPGLRRLTWQTVVDQAAKLGRKDVEVFAYCGPVSDVDLVRQQPTLGILAGNRPGVEDLADLFRLPPVEVAVSEDPVGAQLAAILSQVYALWGGYLRRVGLVRGPLAVGRYMTRVSEEARVFAQALGGRAETFSAASPAWMLSLVAAGMSGPVLEFGAKLGKDGRRARDLPALARKLYQQQTDEGHKIRAYQELNLAHYAARDLGLTLPILAEAHAALWGE